MDVNKKSRYVRITLPKDSRNTRKALNLTEVQVFGTAASQPPQANQADPFAGNPATASTANPAPKADPFARTNSTSSNPNARKGTITNLATGQPTRQSSDAYPPYGDSGKAVDGNTDATFKFDAKNSITHTKDEKSPWWEVDLGEVYDISHIVIWNRLDCCWERLDDYIVTISELPIRLRSSTDYAGVPTSDPTTPNITGVGTWSASLKSQSLGDLGRKGRYVRITLPQGKDPKPLALTEVQVFGK